jgi:hypothetical protein
MKKKLYITKKMSRYQKGIVLVSENQRFTECNEAICIQVTTELCKEGTIYTASASASDSYPTTAFKTAFWLYSPMFVYLTATLSNKKLFIDGFYSKAATHHRYNMLQIDHDSMRGVEQLVMCALLKHVPVGTIVQLTARGTHHPQIAVHYQQMRREPQENVEHSQLWVNWKVNRALVSHYKKYFGFKRKSKRTDVSSRELVASREAILEHCHPNKTVELVTI